MNNIFKLGLIKIMDKIQKQQTLALHKAKVTIKHHPKVQVMTDETAVALMVAQFGFFCVHTSTYLITLKAWNIFNFLYIAMYFLQEIPNAYSFCVCVAAIIDKYMPNTLRIN